MEIKDKHNIYFLGIGGIGMSALAKYFNITGKKVAGYDLTPSAITDELQGKGISIHFNENIHEIPEAFLNKENTLVIRTPAIPPGHAELNYFVENGFEIGKRAELLGILFNDKRGIAIAGTHGKTSVTSMTSHVLHNSDFGCSAFLGGIVKNTNSNLILNDRTNWVVAEADEFDRSFLYLHPEIALVTSIDADHLDIYDSYEKVLESFKEFVHQVKADGIVILHKNISSKIEDGNYKRYTYSLNDTTADFYALNIRNHEQKYSFDIHAPGAVIKSISLPYPGLTNVENAVAAAAAAFAAGVDPKYIAGSLSTFQGVKRRFDIQFRDKKCIYIDDYAHHPREIDAIIYSVRNLFPGKKITGVFQPHLYSRTRDFADDFALSLSKLDELILLEIYPAREPSIAGVNSKMIFDKIKLTDKSLCQKEKLMDILSEKKFEILLTMGAGDIDRYVEKIKQMMERKR